MGGVLKFTAWRSGVLVGEFRINYGLHDSIQDVLNECYFKIDEFVKPHQYLRSWIIEEEETGVKFLAKERANSASEYFDPTRAYRILLLDRPYSELQSDETPHPKQ